VCCAILAGEERERKKKDLVKAKALTKRRGKGRKQRVAHLEPYCLNVTTGGLRVPVPLDLTKMSMSTSVETACTLERTISEC